MEKNVRDKPAYVRERAIKARGGYDLRRICRGLLAVDDLVGEVVRKLDKLDRLDNTLLILTSDNGMSYGSQRILYDKKAPYGTAVPLFMRWPRVLGTVRKASRRARARTSTSLPRCATSPAASWVPTPRGRPGPMASRC